MNVIEIIFSPTGGMEKVAHIIGRQWSNNAVKIDLSDSQIIERLKQISGNGAKCTLVCVYGNRAYEDTIVEMEDAANECGFNDIATVAAMAIKKACSVRKENELFL